VPPRHLSSLAAALAILAGCTVDPGAPSADAPATTSELTTSTPSIVVSPTTTTTTVPLPDAVPVEWEGCGGGLQCATLIVPVDYTDPAAGTLELALVKRPAGDPAQRIGTLLMNPGGPGASGVRRVTRGFTLSDEVARRFDIVGFDPRGVGQSTPITCGAAVPAFRALDLAPDTPEETSAHAAAAEAVADECAASEGERLGHLGTMDVVRDVEVIRRSLGEPQISFVGLSYGTLIGLLWAEAYPTSVRALVLDGVVDPAAGGTASSKAQIDGVEATLDAVDAACTADPDCPTLAAGGFYAAYDELARRIEAGEVKAAGVAPTQLAYAAFYATYDAQRWPRLWAAVADGLAGDLTGVAAMATSFASLVPYAPFALITCLDAPHVVGFDAWVASARRLEPSSPRFAEILGNELLPCAFWPQGTAAPHEVDAAGSPPVLVIGSLGDAATPYAQAVRVAQALAEGVLLTVEIDGHVAIGDSPCATEAATRYLVDLTTPAKGTRC
jgi:pimeloyl-ACP methyl ester carboxylesterase